jgi:hypothetical protein
MHTRSDDACGSMCDVRCDGADRRDVGEGRWVRGWMLRDEDLVGLLERETSVADKLLACA